MDARLTGQTASNLQAIRISEYDHGDCQWITRHTMANWGSFRAKVAGLHPHHVY